MTDLNADLQLAQAMVRAWPDRSQFKAVLRQSEATSAEALEATLSLTSILVGLIATAEGTSKTETLNKIDGILAKRSVASGLD